MIVAGCDIGSLTAKAVLMKEGEIVARQVVRARPNPVVSAEEVLSAATESAGISREAIDCIVGTGYGREQIPFVNHVASEISCHAKGARMLSPEARTVIDIGGQDAKATRMNAEGEVVRYLYNDKCASGSGRFLEVMAETLEIPLEEMGQVGAQSTEQLTISNQCVVFAETEVISLVNEGKATCDIIRALHQALARRVASMARSIEVREKVVMTGGVAKNSGVYQAISEALGVELTPLTGTDPQIVGALGAALFAQEMVHGTV